MTPVFSGAHRSLNALSIGAPQRRDRLKGLFVTFDGVDGAGKSSLVAVVAELLVKQDVKVRAVRLPGGTDLGESLREIFLAEDFTGTASAAALLNFACFIEVYQRIVVPEISKGSVVIADRFVDSCVVYQGEQDPNAGMFAEKLFKLAFPPNAISLRFIVDADAEVCRARLLAGRTPDRFDSVDLGQIVRRRGAFLARQRATNPTAIVVKNNGDISIAADTISGHIRKALLEEC